MSYQVPLTVSSASASEPGTVIDAGSTNNITTYYLAPPNYVSGQPAVEVDLFDIALIDGLYWAHVTHSVIATGGANGVYNFTVKFALPPFTTSLEYDPVLGLVALHTASSQSGGGGGDNTGLIIGLAVGLGVGVPLAAALLILSVIAVAFIVVVVAKRHKKMKLEPLEGDHNL